jgi:3-deoxy-D-manno-octulosonate 8-phosphate phosphatase (KDO 8-P phosphatase)
MKKIKLLILDIDGVMTDGTKEYDKDHNVLSKKFLCKDFTAIKRFSAAGIKVVLLSGDSWNRTMAEKRQLPFFCTRDENLSLDKSIYIDKFESMFGIDRDEMAFVGDDYFDLPMFQSLTCTWCPSDAPDIIKNNAKGVLQAKGGEGVIVDLYDWFIGQNYITQEASMKEVLELDKQELTSVEMK